MLVDVHPLDESGRKHVGRERLEVEAVSPQRFRLLFSPALVQGLAAGDVFEVDDDSPLGFRVIERGGNLCVWLILPMLIRGESSLPPDVIAVRKSVEALGGRLDGGTASTIVFTIPISAGFPAVERLFINATRSITNSHWAFGNVFDPLNPSVPLNWWVKKK